MVSLNAFLVLSYCFSMLFWTFEKTLLIPLLIGFGTLSCFNCFSRLGCSASSISRQVCSFIGVWDYFYIMYRPFLNFWLFGGGVGFFKIDCSDCFY